MALNDELEQDKREFLFLIFRKYVQFRNTIEKILEEREELDDEDIVVLEPYYRLYYQRKMKGNGKVTEGK